jgi:predicted N-acetyltransferase YhbS
MNELTIRPAVEADVPALEALIRRSVHGLQADHYGEAEREAALGSVFGVDHGLIADGTYLVAELDGAVVGCGGWSDREALYGAHGPAESEGPRVKPGSGPARVRAFFVDPDHARKGIGAAILKASEDAARARGFTRAALSATLAGEPFYVAQGYKPLARSTAELPGGGELPIVHMDKRLG